MATYCKSGPSEILDNGKGGYLVPINNSEILSKKINYVIENEKINKEKINFSKKRQKRFYCETQCEKYLNYLNKVL